MQQDMIVILDLGSSDNTLIARNIRTLGVYTEIHPHDISAEALSALPNVRGIILNGGPNRVVDGCVIDASEAVYNSGLPILSVDHAAKAATNSLAAWPENEEARMDTLRKFVFEVCHAQANWNMQNFIADQIDLIRRQVGDRKVLLALSGGVDSSVVAALLIRAIGSQLTCVHVNHGLLRKGEPEQVIEVFRNQMKANLIYVDATQRFLTKLENVSDPEQKPRLSALNLSAYLRKKRASWMALISWRRAPSILTLWNLVPRPLRWSRAIITWAVCRRICVLNW